MFCEGCQDNFCDVCFAAQHRKGTRKTHKSNALDNVLKSNDKTAPDTNGHAEPVDEEVCRFFHVCHCMTYFLGKMDADDDDLFGENEKGPSNSNAPVGLGSSHQPKAGQPVGNWFFERAKHIPVRLTLPERKYLRLLEAALIVSEYTDKIDTLGFNMSKPKRIVAQIREICAIMSGLVLAADYKQVGPCL